MRDGVDGVAGEEQRHGQHLADAHEALARLHQAGDDQREGGEQGRAQHHDQQHAQQGQRVPVHVHAQEQRQQVDDDRLREGAHARPTGALPSTRAARGVGLTRNLCTIPRSRSQMMAMP